MPTYTNPGSQSTGAGDDTIIYTLPPTDPTTVDAGGGSDTLSVHFDDGIGPLSIDISDELAAGFFNVDIRVNSTTPLYVLNFEHAELHGSASDDFFRLQIHPSSSALTVSLDGGAGQDQLWFIWSTLTTNMSFVVSGAIATSDFGTFSNFESYTVSAGSGDDLITTGGGNDEIYTGSGIDHVSTGGGDDYVDAQSLGGSINLGDGNDRVDLTVSASVSQLESVEGGGPGPSWAVLDRSRCWTNLRSRRRHHHEQHWQFRRFRTFLRVRWFGK